VLPIKIISPLIRLGLVQASVIASANSARVGNEPACSRRASINPLLAACRSETPESLSSKQLPSKALIQ
jgi:hypothetical protein